MMARMRAFWSKVGGRDLFVFGGLALSAVGAAMIYPPAALIGAGLALFIIGIFGVPKWD